MLFGFTLSLFLSPPSRCLAFSPSRLLLLCALLYLHPPLVSRFLPPPPPPLRPPHLHCSNYFPVFSPPSVLFIPLSSSNLSLICTLGVVSMWFLPAAMRLINKGCSERLSRDETDLQPLSAGFNMGCTQFTGEDGRGGGGEGLCLGLKVCFCKR